MKKVTKSLLALTLAASALLAGCSGDDEASGKSGNEQVKITFWDENAGPERTPIWEDLIERFEKENPNIDVEYVGIPNKSAKSKYDAAIAANDMPDVGSVQTSWLPEFSIRDALLPLDSYFEKSELKNLINEGAVQFNKDITQDGKLYGIPYTQNLDTLWIRSDWFEEEGVKEPETWDDFFTAIEKMTDKEKNRYGYTIRGGAGGSFQLQRSMFAYSGIETYFDENGKATINDPKHVEFVERYLANYQKYTPKSDITNGYKEMIAGFDTGVVAMVHHNIGSFGEHKKSLEDGQYKALPLPKTEDGKYVAEGGNAINMAVFKSSEHPDAAWKFAEFINSAESQSRWNEQVGQIPTNSDVLKEDWVKNSQHIKIAFDVYDNPDTVLYQPPFYLPDYRSILDNIVDSGTQSVMSGDMTAQEFLDEWAKAMEDSQKQYDKAFKK